MTNLTEQPETVEGVTHVAFLRDLAQRLWKTATPAMGFDQSDTDQLYVIANCLAASHLTPAGAAMPHDSVERATIERCARIATDYAIRMSGAAKRSVSKSAAETFEAHGCAGNNIAAAIQALATNAPEATDAAKREGK